MTQMVSLMIDRTPGVNLSHWTRCKMARGKVDFVCHAKAAKNAPITNKCKAAGARVFF